MFISEKPAVPGYVSFGLHTTEKYEYVVNVYNFIDFTGKKWVIGFSLKIKRSGHARLEFPHT